MPEVNDELIDKLASLSKLEFSQEEGEHIKSDLKRILGFVEQLNEVDVNGVKPLIYVNEDTNVLREDIASTNISQDEVWPMLHRKILITLRFRRSYKK